MIIVPLKEGENIERALKRFKRKFERTGVVKELRKRQAFIKPSVDRRKKKQHAVYVQQMQEDEDLFAHLNFFFLIFVVKTIDLCGRKNI